MERSEKLITRYKVPTKFDFAEYGAACRVQDGDSVSYFIQLSADEEKPNWVPLGNFLEKAFSSYITHGRFLHECLRLYEHNEYSPFDRVLCMMQSRQKDKS